MLVLLISLFVIISKIQTQETIIECGENAEWSESCCFECRTCAYPNVFCRCAPKFGCECLPGYVRNEARNNTCVAVNSLECRAQRYYSYVQLPPTCGPNSVFAYCGVCGPTCTQPCICGRCDCLDGYLRDRNGNCILANSRPCVSESLIPVDPPIE